MEDTFRFPLSPVTPVALSIFFNYKMNFIVVHNAFNITAARFHCKQLENKTTALQQQHWTLG